MRAFALLPLLLVLPACGLDPVTGPTDDPGPVTFGALTLSMESIDFGDVAPDDSGLATLSLTNTGDLPLTILDAKIDTSFFLVEDAGSMLPSEIAAGGVLDMNILFTPDREMDFEGTLTIVTDDVEASEVYVTLSGAGLAGQDTGEVGTGGALSLSTSSIDFGEIPLGTLGQESFSITNSGDEDVLLINVQGSADMWSYGGELALPYVLGAGETRDLSVWGEPAEEGTFTGTLTITSDANNATEVIDLTASSVFYGFPDLALYCAECPKPEEKIPFQLFGGLGASAKTLQLLNYGDAPLTVTDVKLNNSSNAACTFGMAGWGGSKTIAPGGSHDLTVSFNATSGCFVTGSIDVTSDGGSKSIKLEGLNVGG